MPFQFKKILIIKILFFVFVALYAFIIVFKPNLGPTDDFMFLRTLQEGKPLLYYNDSFPYFDAAKYGRFTPLAAMEYNLFGLFSSSPSPFWYYFFHAIQLVIFAVLIVKLFSQFISDKRLAYLISTLLLLLPGFTFVWFRLQMNERGMIFFLTIFLLCFLAYLKQRKISYLVLGIIAANLAIYYKETAFIALGAFGFFYLFFSRKTSDIKIKIFNGLVVLSSVVYAAIYYLYVFPQGGTFTHGRGPEPYVAFLKNILNYVLISDSLIMMIVIPLAAWRLYKIFVKKEEPIPLYDSMLGAATLYVAAFFVLNLYTPYYFLPIYVLAIPPLLYYLGKASQRTIPWKGILAIAIFLLFFNALPMGIHYLTYYKYLPNNFNRALDFVIGDIKDRYPNNRANIFLEGGNNWNYFILSEFLQFKGLSNDRFDLRSEAINPQGPENQPLPLPVPKIILKDTVFKSQASEIRSGDYLIVSPQSDDAVKNPDNKDYLQSLAKDYNLVFKTQSRFFFPMMTLKELGRYFISAGASANQKLFGLISRKKPNLDRPDYYVFIHK